jgi:2,3-bisphosphoglycerate-independent phosphoglycerate mutase
MLKKSSLFPGVKGPVVTIIMDGYGYNPSEVGNAIAAARKPTLDRLISKYSNVLLKAHGTAVGMPSDEDMGNSEVGHNAIGAGQVYSQGAALVANSINSGEIFTREAWKEITNNVRSTQGALHFLGLFSDGNVHSILLT